jgi:hypothetical protein
MNLYLLIFSFIQYPLSFMINITCNLSKATKGILVINVGCDYNLIVKTNRKCVFLPVIRFFNHSKWILNEKDMGLQLKKGLK